MTKPPTSYQEPGGRWVHHFRQSFINDFRHCPEQARQKSQGLVPDSTSDSALVGTLAHAAIECFLLDRMEQDEADILIESYAEEIWPEDLEPTHVANRATGEILALDCFHRWHEYIWPIVREGTWDTEDVEWQFEFLVYEDEHRAIYIQGTADLAGNPDIYDWKTGMRNYGYKKDDQTTIERKAVWQNQRYDAQPSMYSMAKALELGWIDQLDLRPHHLDQATPSNEVSLPDFHYARVPREYSPTAEAQMPAEIVQITRTLGDARALVLEMQHLATLTEARLPHWPLNPVEWWCSSSWCPVNEAGQCRGAFGLHYPSKNTLKGKGTKYE